MAKAFEKIRAGLEEALVSTAEQNQARGWSGPLGADKDELRN